jgi:hypothetical protein
MSDQQRPDHGRSSMPIAIAIATLVAAPRGTRADDAAAPAVAAEPAPSAAEPAPPPAPAPAPPAPYSLAWQLRPAAAVSVVRADTVVATFHDANGDGNTEVTTLLGSYKLSAHFAPLVRVAVVRSTPSAGAQATAISNPLVGVTWAPATAAPLKVGVLAAMTLPLGSGGGDTPDMAAAAAGKAGAMARSAMDNALFAVNDVGLITGVDVAYVEGGFTVQAEATVFELIRARGAMVQPDLVKTNFTSGLHAGYFVTSWLSLGGELRYQRYLSTPAFIAADATGQLRDTMTAAIGVRGHIKLGGGRWLRPGLAYARGLDDPMSGRSYDVIQVDVPFYY